MYICFMYMYHTVPSYHTTNIPYMTYRDFSILYIQQTVPSYHTNIRYHRPCYTTHRATPYRTVSRTIPYPYCTNTTRGEQTYRDTRRACLAQRALEHELQIVWIPYCCTNQHHTYARKEQATWRRASQTRKMQLKLNNASAPPCV